MSRRKFLHLLGVLVCFTLVSGARAQWVQLHGLDTTLIVSSIASEGYFVFVCDRTPNYAPDKLFVSPDDGLSWQDEGTSGIMTLAAIGTNVFGGSLWDGLHTLLGLDTSGFCCWQGENDVWSAGTMLFFDGWHYGKNFSTDSGQTWQAVPTGIVPLFGFDSLWIGSDSLSNVFRSTDLGVMWSNVTGLPDSPYYMITMSGAVLVATNQAAMFRSTDGGRTWGTGENGLPDVSINVLASNANAVFAATASGVFLSTDGGLNWKNWNDGLGSDTVTCFTMNDKYIFVGTQGQGVWRRSLSELSLVPLKQQASDAIVSPNPTTGIVTIHNAPDDLESISIVNVLGERVMDVQDQHHGEVKIDLSRLPSGIYYARFQTEAAVISRMILKE